MARNQPTPFAHVNQLSSRIPEKGYLRPKQAQSPLEAVSRLRHCKQWESNSRETASRSEIGTWNVEEECGRYNATATKESIQAVTFKNVVHRQALLDKMGVFNLESHLERDLATGQRS